jgi:imidazole glycerol phosphate synthase glutamine amidotransferase subunit
MIAILNYGSGGNVGSMKNALDYLKVDSVITDDSQVIANADALIFPGQGAFRDAMESLERKNLVSVIKAHIASGKPFFGICIGYQVLFEGSEEAPGILGLGVFKGRCVKFRSGKVPQIGWNMLSSKNKLFPNDFVYFVNSYYPIPEDAGITAVETTYAGKTFVSVVQKDNITATQFHVEKSGSVGIEILRKWAKGVKK